MQSKDGPFDCGALAPPLRMTGLRDAFAGISTLVAH